MRHPDINTLSVTTEEEFAEHYEPALTAAAEAGALFVIGDANGTDAMAQGFLYGFLDDWEARVTVYHMLQEPRNNFGDFVVVGGFKTDQERDEAMTKDSDADIAWVRPGREKSGTAENLKRRTRA